MTLPIHLAQGFYASQSRRNRIVANRVQAVWRKADAHNLTEWFEAHWEELAAPILVGQESAATEAAAYVAAQAATQDAPDEGATIDPLAFTTDVAATKNLLYSSTVIPVKTNIAEGMAVTMAMKVGTKSLIRLASTMVADAGREATQAGMPNHHMSGQVRMLQLPACDRCAVLAGRWYRWNAQFQRHPQCDCIGVPSVDFREGDAAFDVRAAVRAGRVTGLSQSNRQAILDGADPSQVINARRGMYRANVFGREVQATREGTTVRGVYGRYRITEEGRLLRRKDRDYVRGRNAAGQIERYRRFRTPRLAPAEIYRLADGNRDEALRLLLRYGYLTDGLPTQVAA